MAFSRYDSINAYLIITNLLEGRPLSLKDFRISIARGLVGIPRGQNKGGRGVTMSPKNTFKPNLAQETKFTGNVHLPERGTSRRCAQC